MMLAGGDADLCGDRARSQTVVASDDDDPDAGMAAARDGVRDLWAGRVCQRGQSHEGEMGLDQLAGAVLDLGHPALREVKHPQALLGLVPEHVTHLRSVDIGDRMVAVPVAD